MQCIIWVKTSPQPDGYIVEFFIKFWDIFKDDFARFFREFYAKEHINACFIENFICLIQKKVVIGSVKVFRPISPVSPIYKILAKVLATRLCKVCGWKTA